MNNDREPTGAFGDYFGFDVRTVAIFFGLVVGVLVVVTAIYVAIFGFDNWTTSMNRAGEMMLANVDNPAVGTLPADPTMPQITPAVAAPQAGAQYSCPTCGAVGLPLWSETGTPLCPSCGALMAIAGGAGNNLNLAAAP